MARISFSADDRRIVTSALSGLWGNLQPGDVKDFVQVLRQTFRELTDSHGVATSYQVAIAPGEASVIIEALGLLPEQVREQRRIVALLGKLKCHATT